MPPSIPAGRLFVMHIYCSAKAARLRDERNENRIATPDEVEIGQTNRKLKQLQLSPGIGPIRRRINKKFGG